MPDETSSSAFPYLAVQGADQALAFYQKAFGAELTLRLPDDYGRVSHAEFRIGRATVMIADVYPEEDGYTPPPCGASPVTILVEVPDVDAAFQRAVAAGAVVIRPLQDSLNGTLRTCKLEDPFGHSWMFATRKDSQKVRALMQARNYVPAELTGSRG